MKKLNYTAIIEKSDDGWYVGQVQEIPESDAFLIFTGSFFRYQQLFS